MRHSSIYLKLMCLMVLLGSAAVVCGQTLNTAGETVTVDKTVSLTNNITLTGAITINEGITLTISGNGYTITTNTVSDETTNDKFSFIVYGKLIMNGVVLDGGNTETVGNTVGEGGEGAIAASMKKSGTAIIAYNAATVTLTGVTAKNLYANPKATAAFLSAAYKKTGDKDAVISERAKIDMTNVTVENCLNNNDAGIIYISSEYMKSTFTLQNCTIRNCMVKANGTSTGYGGVIKGAGKTDCNFTMKKSVMEYCWGSGWGGAVLWAANGNNCKAVFEECTFQNNYARYLGGAISSEAVVEIKNCKILNNTAGFGGGGIAAFPFTLADSESGTAQQAIGLTLVGTEISQNRTLYVTNENGRVNQSARVKDGENDQTLTKEIETGFNPRYTILNATDVYYPSGGGGIWVLMNKDKWNCNLNIGSGNTISNNESAYNGGGVFLYKQTPYERISKDTNESDYYNEGVNFVTDYQSGSGVTTMSLGAAIIGNSADCSGGGAAVGADDNTSSTWTYPSVTVNGATIKENTALNGNGGGIYMPGGDFAIQGGKIVGNFAKIREGYAASSACGNGGGISVTNGRFQVESGKSFTISGNTAQRYGGGLSVTNATHDVSFVGATIEKNSALAGGGVSWEGGTYGKTLTMSSDIENNRADNGGGIYLSSAKMQISGGLIRNNQASTTNVISNKTAYQKTVDGIRGVGGGVFMDSNTTLSFSDATNLGIYGNNATNAADDIFANGNSTNVELPDVSNMTLTDFVVPVSENALYWVEDYVVKDTKYSEGTNKKAENDAIVRYRTTLTNPDLKSFKVESSDFENAKTKYLCLALGYKVIYALIQKSGLENGESAIFNVYNMKDSNNPNLYATIRLTGEAAMDKVSKRIALTEGNWKVEETGWSWTYTSSGNKSEEKTISEGAENTFTFINEKKASLEKNTYDESIKVNKMGQSTE